MLCWTPIAEPLGRARALQQEHTLHGGQDAPALAPGGEPVQAGLDEAVHLAHYSRVSIVLPNTQYCNGLLSSLYLLWCKLTDARGSAARSSRAADAPGLMRHLLLTQLSWPGHNPLHCIRQGQNPTQLEWLRRQEGRLHCRVRSNREVSMLAHCLRAQETLNFVSKWKLARRMLT